MLYLTAFNKYFSFSLIYFPLSSHFSPSPPPHLLLFFSLSHLSSLAWMFVFTVLGQAFICSFRTTSVFSLSLHQSGNLFSSLFLLTQIDPFLFFLFLWVFFLHFSALYCARTFLWGCINSSRVQLWSTLFLI